MEFFRLSLIFAQRIIFRRKILRCIARGNSTQLYRISWCIARCNKKRQITLPLFTPQQISVAFIAMPPTEPEDKHLPDAHQLQRFLEEPHKLLLRHQHKKYVHQEQQHLWVWHQPKIRH